MIVKKITFLDRELNARGGEYRSDFFFFKFSVWLVEKVLRTHPGLGRIPGLANFFLLQQPWQTPLSPSHPLAPAQWHQLWLYAAIEMYNWRR
jgi:hypothetical protein